MKINIASKNSHYPSTYLMVGVVMLSGTFYLGCTKNRDNYDVTLEGNWVEATSRLDTLEFYTIDDSDFFELKRGFEMRNGSRLPKYGAGLYTYQVSVSDIHLKSLLSSNSEFLVYPFKLKSKTLQIGDFYNASSGKILTFKKLN